MPYMIVFAEDRAALEEEVNERMEDGYELVGGVSYDPKEKDYIQAMILRETKD